MYIRILFENNYKTRWLGMGENYTIESLKNLIKTFSKVCGFDGVAYQLEYKSI